MAAAAWQHHTEGPYAHDQDGSGRRDERLERKRGPEAAGACRDGEGGGPDDAELGCCSIEQVGDKHSGASAAVPGDQQGADADAREAGRRGPQHLALQHGGVASEQSHHPQRAAAHDGANHHQCNEHVV